MSLPWWAELKLLLQLERLASSTKFFVPGLRVWESRWKIITTLAPHPRAPKACSALASLQSDVTFPSWVTSKARAPVQRRPAQALQNGYGWIQSDLVSQRPPAHRCGGCFWHPYVLPGVGTCSQASPWMSVRLHSLSVLQPAVVLKCLGIFVLPAGECSPNRWAHAAEAPCSPQQGHAVSENSLPQLNCASSTDSSAAFLFSVAQNH